jgi:23S rRNA (guanosine2251-2'-O)-methyltransferase
MGSEDKGISNKLLEVTDNLAKIPLMGDIDSLNVSVATGVFLFEVVRQRHS